jgi:DNA-binding NtrC family response regulator
MSSDRAIPILMVDDEVEFLEATSRALRRRGFEVYTATDGRAALEVLARQAVAVAVLDVRMPGINGLELFGRIKVNCPDLPVVMLTGHGNVQQAFQTSREGVFEYLTKPCEVEKLADVVRRAAGAHDAAAAEGDDSALEGPVRLLFVDDEVEFLESLAPALARRGMDVTPAATPELALGYAADQLFDVALVDMKMPGMDGLTLARHLRARQPLLEVVMLTGHPTMGQAFEAVKEGAFDFLMKPLAVEAIVDKVRQAQRQARRRQEAQRAAELQQILEDKAR